MNILLFPWGFFALWWWGWNFFFYYLDLSSNLSTFANHKHLQGEEAKNVPGESVTEEHYMDHDGNLISRKVMYKCFPVSHSALKFKRVGKGFTYNRPTFRSFLLLSMFFYFGQVIRKVIRRVSTPTPENQGSSRWHSDLQLCPTLQDYEAEVGIKTHFNCVASSFNPHWDAVFFWEDIIFTGILMENQKIGLKLHWSFISVYLTADLT